MVGFFRKITLGGLLAMGAGGGMASPGLELHSYENRDMNVFVIEKDSMTFGVSDSPPVNSDFFVNANFFDNNGPIGLVVVNGTRTSNRVRQGGFFYVLNDQAYVDASTSPRYTEFNAQSILSAIDNGIPNTALTRTRHGKKRTYRTLIGQTQTGDIVFIASGRAGLVTISEIINLAIENNVYDAILLDGGSSVDYRFGRTRFKSIPNVIKNVMEIEEPKTYIYGNFNDN